MSDAFREMVELTEELGLYDEPLTVCVTHKRFTPCRKDDGCIFSSDPEDIGMVQKFQSGS
jgi:hypothetical protein